MLRSERNEVQRHLFALYCTVVTVVLVLLLPVLAPYYDRPSIKVIETTATSVRTDSNFSLMYVYLYWHTRFSATHIRTKVVGLNNFVLFVPHLIRVHCIAK